MSDGFWFSGGANGEDETTSMSIGFREEVLEMLPILANGVIMGSRPAFVSLSGGGITVKYQGKRLVEAEAL